MEFVQATHTRSVITLNSPRHQRTKSVTAASRSLRELLAGDRILVSDIVLPHLLGHLLEANVLGPSTRIFDEPLGARVPGYRSGLPQAVQGLMMMMMMMNS